MWRAGRIIMLGRLGVQSAGHRAVVRGGERGMQRVGSYCAQQGVLQQAPTAAACTLGVPARWLTTSHATGASVAVLFQACPAPPVGGVARPMKPGGYRDSGADVAATLRSLSHERRGARPSVDTSPAGIGVVTPAEALYGQEPDERVDDDWVFPDTSKGIQDALAAGANVLWANTVLHSQHPLCDIAQLAAASAPDGQVPRVVASQDPRRVEEFDDKLATNALLRRGGLSVAQGHVVETSHAVGASGGGGAHADTLLQGMRLPVVVKPVRGRGSAGVGVVHTVAELVEAVDALRRGEKGVDNPQSHVIVEEFLSGREVTVAVMPPARLQDEEGHSAPVPGDHWCLPPMERFNHVDGVAPYNGVVAVTHNSRVLSGWQDSPACQDMLRDCAAAAAMVGAAAPIRIDCRELYPGGPFKLFDLNMKPNMTGPGRPGRDDQDSLVCMAAAAHGWSFQDLLCYIVHNARQPDW